MKYKAFKSINLPNREWPNKTILIPPTWCSVDLRDGNQALPNPMGIQQKMEMFKWLCEIGFKEIEIGFPAASQTEYDFCRALIEGNNIPNDVKIQVLTQARPQIIDRTFQALKGAENAIIHFYNSTNPAQRKVVFDLSQQQIKDIAVEAAKQIQDAIGKAPETNWTVEYSPESFSLTELEFSLDVCIGVLEQLKTTTIINLPATVESAMPNVYADQIEWMVKWLVWENSPIISVHTHNDRGTGVAATELAILAGATRVEGTLFGNGERTGNADLVTLALNLFSQGIDPQLNLYNMPALIEKYTKLTGMGIHERHPYAGELVFTAFSGSHQDAIAKGLNAQKESPTWEVPYLPIDPKDIGLEYEPIIRINSQSGKGGAKHVLEKALDITLPKPLSVELGHIIKKYSDKVQREISQSELLSEFFSTFCVSEPISIGLVASKTNQEYQLTVALATDGSASEFKEYTGTGTGPIHALCNILTTVLEREVSIDSYQEFSMQKGESATAMAVATKGTLNGVGIHPNIEMAALKAVISLVNRQNQ